jgi:Na+/proline symporter
MIIIDYSLDPSSRYTLWSGLTGGFFLALAYFGTDQSQVQRYLSGKSVKISTLGLMFNGILKIPMQFLILLTGVLVFVFYQFNTSPVFFNQSVLNRINNTEAKAEIMALQAKKDSITLEKSLILKEIYSKNAPSADHDEKKALIRSLMQEEKGIMSATKEVIAKSSPDAETNDKDYVFISFILNHLPQGLVGLLLAVIFCAAMSSTAAELNALAATTTVDFYKRKWADNRQEDHYVKSTKVFTLIWGLIAIAFASIGTLFENLIQLVNIVGSVFYGTILGIFLTGFYFKRVGGNAVFTGAVIAEAIVLFTFFFTETGYLWLNLIGCVCVILFSSIIQMIRPSGMKTKSAD